MQINLTQLGGDITFAVALSLPLAAFASSSPSKGTGAKVEAIPSSTVSGTLQQNQAGRKITGVVMDESGQPIIGATVSVKSNPKLIAVTDADGQFSINAGSNDVLVFSYIGFQNKEVSVKDKRVLSVTMKEDANLLYS